MTDTVNVRDLVLSERKLQSQIKRLEAKNLDLLRKNEDLWNKLSEVHEELLEERGKVQQWLYKRLEGQQI